MRRARKAALPLLAAAAAAGDAGAQARNPELERTPVVSLEAAYAGDLYAAISGGQERGAEYVDNLDLIATVDLAPLFGARTLLRAHIQSNRGGSISERVGDFQGVSNVEAPADWRLYALWLEHNLVLGRLSVLVGVHDVNAELDVIPIAADFLNSSFGIGPEYSGSGLNGAPTYPLTTLGVRLKARPWEDAYVALSVHDGSPGRPDDPSRDRLALGDGEGALVAWEIGYTRPVTARGAAGAGDRADEGGRRIGRGRHLEDGLRTKLALGAWSYTRDFAPWTAPDGEREKSRGVYALAERLVAGGGDDPALSVFGRVGLANGEVERIDWYAGGGAVASGFLPGRPGDAAGLGVAHARNGSPFLDARSPNSPLERAETVVELYYRLHLSEAFQLQPDVQWVVDPGMDPELSDAIVLGLRGTATVSFP